MPKKYWEYEAFQKANPEFYQLLVENKFNEKVARRKLEATWNSKLPKELQETENDEYCIQPEIFNTEKTQSLGGLDYYEFCQQILREFRFKKGIHRVIFSLHAEGLSEREICNKLLVECGVKVSQKGINLILNRTKESFLKGV